MSTEPINLNIIGDGVRLLQGHPMVPRVKLDDKGNKVLDDAGQPVMQIFVAIGVPKQPGHTHWSQTDWGNQIYAKGQADWPNGEFQAPAFAWKIEDGDSAVPNKRGTKNCDRVGFPGHWIVKLSTQFDVKCFGPTVNGVLKELLSANEMKTGDYVAVMMDAKGNGPSQTPGVYLHPKAVQMVRPGEAIVSAGSVSDDDVSAAFGGQVQAAFGAAPAAPAAGVVPPIAMAPTAVVAPGGATAVAPPAATAAVAPAAPEYLTPTAVAPPPLATAPVTRHALNGQVFTVQQLKDSGWEDAAIAQLPPA